jgi:flagellar hook protein FlgE
MGALGAAISGLQASQKWLDVISNNVSNSQTVAYKQGRLTFSDLISEGLRSASGPNNGSNLGGINPNQVGLGVTVGSVQTIMKQGALQVTGNVADIAVQGTGFMTISKGTETLYSRAGNLTFDQQGNLVTSDGGQVQGWSLSVDRTSAAPPVITAINTRLDTSSPAAIGNIQIPNNLVVAPRATTLQLNASVKTEGVVIKGNLDNATPQNPAASTVPPAAGALVSGAALVGGELAGVIPDAVNTFTAYDSLGTAYDMTMWWFQTNAAVPGGQAQWEWAMFYTPNGVAPTDDPTLTWANLDQGVKVADSLGYGGGGTGSTTSDTGANPITFNADGSLANNGTGTLQNVTVAIDVPNGAVGPGGAAGNFAFSLNLGTPNDPLAVPITLGLRDGLTGDYGNGSFDPLTGVYQPQQTVYTDFADGYPQGTLTGLSFNQTGGVDARFSNGQVIEVAKIAMSKFANQDGLERIGGNYFRATANSGLAQVGVAGTVGFGTVQGGALESSNVDLTVELTNMILAQRMFESNARVVTAADRVLDTLVNLGR